MHYYCIKNLFTKGHNRMALVATNCILQFVTPAGNPAQAPTGTWEVGKLASGSFQNPLTIKRYIP